MGCHKQGLLKQVMSVLFTSSLLIAATGVFVSHVNAVSIATCTIGISCTAGGVTVVIGSATYPTLGTAASFSVLGATTVTNTGSTMLTSNLGVSLGSSCTGFPAPCTAGPGTLGGAVHVADAMTIQAQADAMSAYTFATTQTCTTTFPAITDIGGMTLTPGVYCFPSSAGVTGTLTLDAQNNPAAVFTFRIGSTLTMASGSKVVLINRAQPSKVFWQVGSSATLGAATSFAGSVIALTSITVMTAATSSCGLYALNGAVTLDSNIIQTCSPLSCSLSLSSHGGWLLSELSKEPIYGSP